MYDVCVFLFLCYVMTLRGSSVTFVINCVNREEGQGNATEGTGVGQVLQRKIQIFFHISSDSIICAYTNNIFIFVYTPSPIFHNGSI